MLNASLLTVWASSGAMCSVGKPVAPRSHSKELEHGCRSWPGIGGGSTVVRLDALCSGLNCVRLLLCSSLNFEPCFVRLPCASGGAVRRTMVGGPGRIWGVWDTSRLGALFSQSQRTQYSLSTAHASTETRLETRAACSQTSGVVTKSGTRTLTPIPPGRGLRRVRGQEVHRA